MKNLDLSKIDPYSSSIGELINTSSLTKKLEEYMLENKYLGYEYASVGDAHLVFITGRNHEETNLPTWEHPLLFKNTKDEYVIATDLRKYLKPIKDDIINISDVVKDEAGYLFQVTRVLLMDEMVNDNFGALRSVQKNIVSGFSVFVSAVISNSVMLDPAERVNVEIALQHHMYLRMLNGTPDVSDISTIAAKIANTKLSLPVNKKSILNMVDLFTHEPSDIDSLVENIKLAIGNVKANYITSDVLINILANVWFGPGGSETSIMSLENAPTWIAMLFVSIDSKVYKKSRVATVLDKFRTKLKLNTIDDIINKYIEERKI